MKEITRSQIMKAAWKLVKMQGMNMSEALKTAWAEAKKLVAKRTVRIADWVCVKNLGCGLGADLRTGEVVRETEKAVLVNLGYNVGAEELVWSPKSAIEAEYSYKFAF